MGGAGDTGGFCQGRRREALTGDVSPLAARGVRRGRPCDGGMSRSVWNEIIVDDACRETFEASTSAVNMPEHDKYQINATLEGRAANSLGLIGNITCTVRIGVVRQGLQVVQPNAGATRID